MIDNDEQPAKPVVIAPDREVFAITRLGLPLNLKDNLLCGLVIVLAITLQARLSHTFLAEGLIAFAGFIGYVAMRYWILTRRCPDPGELIIDEGILYVPASINGGHSDSFALSECTVKFSYNKGKSGDIATSVVFRHGAETIKINSFGVNLGKLEQALKARNVPVTREYWQMGLYVAGFILLAALMLFAYVALFRQ